MIETPPVKNILFAQDSSPCIRTIKYATALQAKGLYIHLAHRNKTPDEAFKFGNASIATLTRLPESYPRSVALIKRLVKSGKIDMLHYCFFRSRNFYRKGKNYRLSKNIRKEEN